jgi:nucleoside 2-deoxyribosyltransferase
VTTETDSQITTGASTPMSKPSVYLAGPITGESYECATDWRTQIAILLAAPNDAERRIAAFSPLRCKPYLAGEQVLGQSYEQHVLSSARGIFTRDYHDCRACDALIVNFLDATRVSIGTVMEIAWATAFRKPIIVIMEPEGNVHEHVMLSECYGFRVTTLEQAVHAAQALLLPGLVGQ